MAREQPRKKNESASTPKSRRPDKEFLVVAIGASAGGIDAFSELMKHLPADTGMGFVIVQHLDPRHESILSDLLAKQTAMKVTEVRGGMPVEPNHVYIIPPNASMTMSDHALKLGPREATGAAHLSIDHFMRSLAEGQGDCAIGVILSGSGTDGTLGMAEIQAQGGVTFAQEPSTATYDGMPRSAIAAGCVDYILPPKAIARELARIARHPYLARQVRDSEPVPEDHDGLGLVFQLLRRTTGVDFTHYRQTTILRRIQRRMVVHKLDKFDDYVKYVQNNPAEIKGLYQDMLINVTSFFRNPRVFDSMKREVFPQISRNRGPESPIRVWTPGCASGEETYSVAITLLEYLGEKALHTSIQFFGTDVSETSIIKARAGLYPENIQSDVSPQRLRRFFNKVDNGYRISKTIRDTCIFATHNVINDPPFSQMDLICCRNLLIYLEPVLQNKVISLFHYAARPGGFLVLGNSEGSAMVSSLFSTADRNDRIFMKKPATSRQIVTFSLNQKPDPHDLKVGRAQPKTTDGNWSYLEAQKEFDRRLLSNYAPAAVFLNEDLEIIHTRGSVNRYLKLASGRASLSILKMAREGLLLDLRNALAKAKREGKAVSRRNIEVKVASDEGEGGSEETRHISLEVSVIHLGRMKDVYFMVLFQETPMAHRSAAGKGAPRPGAPEKEATRAGKLEDELNATKEYLQSVIETQEATNEELQSANEEILSSNEELQSTNEELETAKEELQSANEELTTVNDELRSRNLEITQINNDLTNLLANIDIAVMMVGNDLTIQRFTPRAQELFGLIPGDVGRPFMNINPLLDIHDFQKTVLQVISSLQKTEREVADRAGNPYQLRVLPYRTAEGKLDGAIITLITLPPRVSRQK